jgi:hypothetical protein
MYSVKVYENADTSIEAESSGEFIIVTLERGRHIERTWLQHKEAKELAEGILFLVQSDQEVKKYHKR